MTVEALFDRLEALEAESATKAGSVRARIQTELARQYDDWKELQTTLAKLEAHEGVEYQGEEDGIYAFVRFYDASDVPDRERDYLQEYLSDKGVRVDFQNDCLMSYQGNDHYQIQDDAGRGNNGVWQGHKLIIDESEYLARYLNEKRYDSDTDPEFSEDDDDARRNALIEAHMEKSGYFPGVFRCDRHGNIFPVSTVSPDKNGE